MRENFWLGFFAHAFIACLFQDYYGLDRYISLVSAGWVDLRWWVWLFPLALVMWRSYTLEKEAKQTRGRSVA